MFFFFFFSLHDTLTLCVVNKYKRLRKYLKCAVFCWYAICSECIPGQARELFIGVSSPVSELAPCLCVCWDKS